MKNRKGCLATNVFVAFAIHSGHLQDVIDTDSNYTDVCAMIRGDKTTTAATNNPISLTDHPGSTVTDVSSEPATTSFVQAVSGVTDGDACPDLLAKNNLPCRCPFNAGLYKLPPTTFVLPDLGTISALAKGDYKVKAMFYDDDTGKRLACQVIETSISDGGPEEPCTSPDCIIG